MVLLQKVNEEGLNVKFNHRGRPDLQLEESFSAKVNPSREQKGKDREINCLDLPAQQSIKSPYLLHLKSDWSESFWVWKETQWATNLPEIANFQFGRLPSQKQVAIWAWKSGAEFRNWGDWFAFFSFLNWGSRIKVKKESLWWTCFARFSPTNCWHHLGMEN